MAAATNDRPIDLRLLAGTLLFVGAIASTRSDAFTLPPGPTLPSAVTSASMGVGHGCATTPLGTLRCWGSNSEGQLGEGTTTSRQTPVTVPLAGSTFQVATGAAHTCAIIGGTVSCWGRNTFGQLGDGTTTSRSTPAPVVGLESLYVLSIAAGQDHTCAVVSFGAVRCWGANHRGQLGDGTTAHRSTPVPVPMNGRALALGVEHSCLKTFSDTVRCWGRNSEGQLGDGTTVDRLVPVEVWEGQVMRGVVNLVAGGYHSCVTDQYGGLKCWGSNSNGQIGDGTTTSRSMPSYPIQLGADMVAVAAGLYHSCGVHRSGTTYCWGFNQSGQVGDGTPSTQHLAPTEVSGLGNGGARVSAGGDQSCAITRLGGLMCWGANNVGQLGDGSNVNRPRPSDVFGLKGVATIKAGQRHNCVITPPGYIACWGANDIGQDGDGTTIARDMPKMIDGYNASALALGSNHACVNGLCWGDNRVGQFGDGTTVSSSIPAYQAAGQFDNVVEVAAGEWTTCALSASSGVRCWGNNASGQLGDGTTIGRLSPVTVSGLASGVATIATGGYHSCAVTVLGAVKCWGNGTAGQLGTGSSVNSSVPVNVSGLSSGVSAVVTGNMFSCALTTAGGVKCWGTGEVVGGYTLKQATPIDIPGLATGVTGLSAGSVHACARLDTGAVKCWGRNLEGQVGDGTTISRYAPVSVAGITTGAAIVAAGYEHTCVLMLSGTVQCWGRNPEGRLGDGTTTDRLAPVYALSVLSIARTGSGTGSVTIPNGPISCGATCSANVPFGGQQRLMAFPAANTEFAGWSGGLCFGTAPCDLTVYRPTTVGANFRALLVQPADFNRDGHSDLVWSNTGTGATYVWHMAGTPPALLSDAFVTLIDRSWKVQGIADFNGDGKPDLVWRNTESGNTYVWYMDGTTFISDAFLFGLPPQWVIQGVADFNADGKPDFLMRNTVSGVAFAWFFNDSAALGDQFLFGIDPVWKVEQVGDLDHDNQPDLLFRNTTSGLAFAWMTAWSGSGLSLAASSAPIFAIAPAWEIVQLADWNLDGNPDLVFRNATSGLVFVWYLDANAALGPGSDFVNQIDPTWEIVPRR